MSRRTHSEMFALPAPPPEWLTVAGCAYRLQRVFKHDFWAATCLYEADGLAAGFPRIVVKFGRTQPLWGLPIGFYSRWLRAHEKDIYLTLAGVPGVPRWVGQADLGGYAIEYIDARPLDHLDTPPEGFFDRLREVFDEIHARGVAYGDANKRSNILVNEDGLPYLIDFQISIRRRENWPWPLRSIVNRAVRYLTAKDIYHLYKHKRRMAPSELTDEQRELSYHRSGLHGLHRKLTKPYRATRRWLLQRLFRRGMRSPTDELEDHYQPEKETWRRID